MGDVLIGKCVEYLVEQCLKELKDNTAIEIRHLDLCGRENRLGSVKTTCFDIAKKRIVKKYKEMEKKISLKYIRNKIDRKTIGVIFYGPFFDCDGSRQYFVPACQCMNYCHRFRIPVMLAGISSISSLSNDSITEVKKFVNDACVKVISMRDDDSLVSLGVLKLDERISVYETCDIAWCTNELYCCFNKKNNNKVGICIGHSDLLYNYSLMPEEKQLKWWHGLIKEFLEQGRDVILFTNGYRPDYEMARKVFSYCSDITMEQQIEIKNIPCSVEEYISYIMECSCIVTLRMHAGIIAYTYGIPMVMLRWNKKQDDFCRQIERASLCVDVNEISHHNIANLALFDFEDYGSKSKLKYYQALNESFREFIDNLSS